jgi:hypothetical protein
MSCKTKLISEEYEFTSKEENNPCFCGRSNCKDVCYSFDYKELDDLQYSIKNTVCKLGRKKIDNLFWGYGCEEDIDVKVGKLRILDQVVERYKTGIYYETAGCLCASQFQDIKEQVIDLVDVIPCDIDCRLDLGISDENLAQHIMDGNTCISYDRYEKFAKQLCQDLNITLTSTKEICDLTLSLSADIISCDVLFAIKVYKQMCDLGYSVSRNIDECKLDWTLLLEKTDCNLDFDLYKELIDCNLSYDIIKEIYSCGLELEVINNNPELVTPIGRYKLFNLAENKYEILTKYGLETILKEEDLTSDYCK